MRILDENFKMCIFVLASAVLLSLALYKVGGFGWLYLAAANALGLLVFYVSWRLLIKKASREAWRVYKLSAYPYLGLLFLFMGLDFWV